MLSWHELSWHFCSPDLLLEDKCKDPHLLSCCYSEFLLLVAKDTPMNMVFSFKNATNQ